jgi:hypothetical protein
MNGYAEGRALAIRVVLAAVAVTALGTAGCSAAAASGTAGTSCGVTKTAVNVPVTIQVAKGSVSCATAVRIEQDYAAEIRQGDLKGNGGGSPVTVDGWTCQGYPTPEVLRTGNASECHTTNAEVVAVLSLPSGPVSASLRSRNPG